MTDRHDGSLMFPPQVRAQETRSLPTIVPPRFAMHRDLDGILWALRALGAPKVPRPEVALIQEVLNELSGFVCFSMCTRLP